MEPRDYDTKKPAISAFRVTGSRGLPGHRDLLPAAALKDLPLVVVLLEHLPVQLRRVLVLNLDPGKVFRDRNGCHVGAVLVVDVTLHRGTPSCGQWPRNQHC